MFLRAGPSSAHMGAGLDPAGPARPGHWPKPVTRLANIKHAWIKSRMHVQVKGVN